MNYSNFAARVKQARPNKPKLTIYPQELLQTVEKLHFDDRIDLKTIATELRKEPEWSSHTHAALHSAFSRHCRKVAQVRNLPRRAPYTKPKAKNQHELRAH
jgi:hypothetical protein